MMVRAETGVEYRADALALYEVLVDTRHGYRLLLCMGPLRVCAELARERGCSKVCWLIPEGASCPGTLRRRVNCCVVEVDGG